MSRIVIVTGARGAGKTSACLELIEQARQLGLDCAGLISPARIEGGLRAGIDVVDIRSWSSRRFATQNSSGEAGRAGGHRFEFDGRGLGGGPP